MKTVTPCDNIERADSTYSKIDPCTSLEGIKGDISIRNTPQRYNEKISEVAQIQEHNGGFWCVQISTTRYETVWKEGHFKTSRNVSVEL
jgi:hypothetical protein